VLCELILDGAATSADLSDFRPGRFAEGWTAVAEHDYGRLWR